MTIEKAAEIVSKMTDRQARIELFCHFEENLNPHPPKTADGWSEASFKWQKMFAKMCGFGTAQKIFKDD